MSKIFLDANILLDILIPSRTNHKKAVEAYIKICDEFERLATSENILTTIEYIALKNGTDCKAISDFFDNLYKNFELYSFEKILHKSLAIYKKACLDNIKIDFEDLLQLESAIENNCTAFITEDRGIHKLDVEIKVLLLDDILGSKK